MGNAQAGSGDGPRLNILEAHYGAGAEQQADVTELVRSHVSGLQIQLQISNAVLRCDPAPGAAKRLVLRLGGAEGAEGEPTTVTVYENCNLDLYYVPWEAGRLHIARAVYGCAKGSRLTDVSGALARKVRGDALAVVVGNELAGGDPAPGLGKILTVHYISPKGMRMRAVVEEGKELTFVYGVYQGSSTIPVFDRATSHQW